MNLFSTERGTIAPVQAGETIPPLLPAGDFEIDAGKTRVETFFGAGGGFYARIDGGNLYRLNVLELVIAVSEADAMIKKQAAELRKTQRANGGSNAN